MRKFCPSCGRLLDFDPYADKYFCTGCPKSYTKEAIELLEEIKEEGLNLSFCLNSNLRISHVNLIKRVLESELEDGLESGIRAKYINNPEFSDKQQDAIYAGLTFERMFELEPGTIVECYANPKISFEDMKEMILKVYYEYFPKQVESYDRKKQGADLIVYTKKDTRTKEEKEARRHEIDEDMKRIRKQEDERQKSFTRKRTFWPFK